jgi:hypothetical protein
VRAMNSETANTIAAVLAVVVQRFKMCVNPGAGPATPSVGDGGGMLITAEDEEEVGDISAALGSAGWKHACLALVLPLEGEPLKAGYAKEVARKQHPLLGCATCVSGTPCHDCCRAL